MPGTNDFLPFGTGGTPNVITEAAYSALAARTAGYSTGTAVSAQLNKTWRQSSIMAAAWGQIIANSGANAVDDGNVTTIVTQILAALSSLLSNQVPIGGIVMWGNATPPTNWLECNGAAVSRTTYSVLFGIIGTNYGAGDGTTTFNLPDFRGEFVRGYDHGRGVDASRVLGSFQDWATGRPKTTTPVRQKDDGSTMSLVGGAANPSQIGFARCSNVGEGVTTKYQDNVQTYGGEPDQFTVCTGDPETRPRNVSVVYIIRYQ